MKKDLILLVDLLKNIKESEEGLKYEIDYKPDKKSISIDKDGISKDARAFFRIPKQVFQTEDFVYYPILDENNNPCLISKGVTSKKLYVGYGILDYSIDLMKRICSLYDSKQLNARGKLITEELIRMLPSYLLTTESSNDSYFIDKTFTDDRTIYPISEMDPNTILRISNLRICDRYLFICKNGKISRCFLEGLGGAKIIESAYIRPVIVLPKDIMVDTSEISDKKLTLYRK